MVVSKWGRVSKAAFWLDLFSDEICILIVVVRHRDHHHLKVWEEVVSASTEKKRQIE